MAAASSVPGPGVPFVCSWSGGKDSCLALHRALSAGAEPSFLLSVLRGDGARSRSHGLSTTVLRAQATALGIPLATRNASWPQYEQVFIAALRDLRAMGVEAGVFGDIDVDPHRLWEERICEAAGIEAHLPLWKTPRHLLLDEFVSLGFEAMVIAANDEKMGRQYVGRMLDWGLAREFERIGVDPSGEEGEYHSVVTNGPPFAEPLRLDRADFTRWSGYWFLDVSPRAPRRSEQRCVADRTYD